MGISLGAVGTAAGGIAGVAIASALLLTGVGEFIVIGLVAGAVGAGGYELGKSVTEKLFEEMGW